MLDARLLASSSRWPLWEVAEVCAQCLCRCMRQTRYGERTWGERIA